MFIFISLLKMFLPIFQMLFYKIGKIPKCSKKENKNFPQIYYAESTFWCILSRVFSACV